MNDRKTLLIFNDFRVMFKKSVANAKTVMKILCLHDNQDKRDYIEVMKYLDDISTFLELIKGDPEEIKDFIDIKKFKKVKKNIQKEIESNSIIDGEDFYE